MRGLSDEHRRGAASRVWPPVPLYGLLRAADRSTVPDLQVCRDPAGGSVSTVTKLSPRIKRASWMRL